ncbi:MAG: ribonucleotide-diphosphate reductase subunit beta, partial [Planktothrix sp.]
MDELSHVRLYQKIIPEAMQTFPHSIERIYEMFDNAVKHEILWVNHIVGNNILGITEQSTEQYIKYLANIRLRAIGLENLYTEPIYSKNCYAHL